MTIYFASDHAGFALKESILAALRTEGKVCEDLGALEFDPADDYPDYMTACAQAVVRGTLQGDFGIIFGKSGQGEAMAANRIKGARAAVYYGGTLELVRLAREHNNANILSLAAGFLSVEEAREAVRVFLETPFSNDPRHVRRLAKF